jgi:Ribonuclease G/E
MAKNKSMDYKEILTISGKSGLFRLVSQSKKNAIVESLTEHTRCPLFMSNKASSLEEIYLFTEEGSIPLKEVFQKIYAYTGGGKAIDAKTPETEVRKYMAEVLPEYDRNRVHYSDMKRLFTWYNILLECNMLIIEDGDAVAGPESGDGEQEANPA